MEFYDVDNDVIIDELVIHALEEERLNLNSGLNVLSGQTCGQVRKMGLFNPRCREEQAQVYFVKKSGIMKFSARARPSSVA